MNTDDLRYKLLWSLDDTKTALSFDLSLTLHQVIATRRLRDLNLRGTPLEVKLADAMRREIRNE